MSCSVVTGNAVREILQCAGPAGLGEVMTLKHIKSFCPALPSPCPTRSVQGGQSCWAPTGGGHGRAVPAWAPSRSRRADSRAFRSWPRCTASPAGCTTGRCTRSWPAPKPWPRRPPASRPAPAKPPPLPCATSISRASACPVGPGALRKLRGAVGGGCPVCMAVTKSRGCASTGVCSVNSNTHCCSSPGTKCSTEISPWAPEMCTCIDGRVSQGLAGAARWL